MESTVEFTVATAPFARAAARADRLLPPRAARAGGVRVAVAGRQLRLSASGEEAGVWGDVPATVNTDGVVAVGRRALAATLASLDAPEVRVRVEGSRLAIRTGSARFALPLLDPAALGPAPEPPPVAGRAPAGAFMAAVAAVAGAASRDGLPLFSGVRVRSDADRLRLAATDRFRLAVASVPWSGEGPVDVLIPAGILAEAARMLAKPETAEVTVLADADRLGLSWAEGGVVVSSLALPYPDAQLERMLSVRPECVVDVDADLLRAAVERAMPFAGPIGTVTLEAADGVVVVRGSDDGAGDSREEVKAETTGSTTASYQGRYLLDSLRAFGDDRVVLRFQTGIQPTSITAAAHGTTESAAVRSPGTDVGAAAQSAGTEGTAAQGAGTDGTAARSGTADGTAARSGTADGTAARSTAAGDTTGHRVGTDTHRTELRYLVVPLRKSP